MKYEDDELDRIIQELIDEVQEDNLREELDYRLHRLKETEDSFDESQEAVLYALKRINVMYFEGELTVFAYDDIMELVGKAEI